MYKIDGVGLGASRISVCCQSNRRHGLFLLKIKISLVALSNKMNYAEAALYVIIYLMILALKPENWIWNKMY